MILHCGDCLEILPTLDENSIDACVTDPPYHLVDMTKRYGNPDAKPCGAGKDGSFRRLSRGFMGKQWDGGDIAFRPETWAAVYRVLKPGAHLLAFGGTRTYHRMACAIEDAGFEIRDQIQWLYGSGFPKSHDVSKGIDRAAGAEREVVGTDTKARSTSGNSALPTIGGDTIYQTWNLTAPATAAARQWQGWGTALKPANEPMVLARKPLSEKTVAANVLKWGTGALNIDGCRIGTEVETWPQSRSYAPGKYNLGVDRNEVTQSTGAMPNGRWPANLIHDGSEEVVGAFPESGPPCGSAKKSTTQGTIAGSPNAQAGSNAAYVGDSGSAARFFASCGFSDIDSQWRDQSHQIDLAKNAGEYLPLQSETAVSVLRNAVTQSTPQWALQCTGSPARSMNVTPKELGRISEIVTETILNLGERYSPESLPAKHTQSDSLASIAAIREQTDTITITISLSKSNGYAEPVTFNITRQNEAVGVPAYGKRFHYCAKASKQDRNGSKHPTVKPLKLMRYLCRLITPPGGTILDPFAGSGTTGQAARDEGFRAVLIEREQEYQDDIRRRMDAPQPAQASLI